MGKGRAKKIAKKLDSNYRYTVRKDAFDSSDDSLEGDDCVKAEKEVARKRFIYDKIR